MGRKIYLGIIYSITALCMIFGACFHVFNFVENSIFNDFFGKVSGNGSQVQKEEALSSFDNMNLDLSVMSVTIYKGDSYKISYNCSEKFVPKYEVKDGTLYVTQDDLHLNLTDVNNPKCSLTITVPTDSLSDLTAQVDVGDLLLKDITLSNLDISADVGDLDITNVTTENCTIQADVGDVNLKDIEMKTGTIDANVGDIEIKDIDFTSLEIMADLGDVDVLDVTSLEDYRIDLETDLGDVSVDKKEHKREYFSEGSGDKKLTIYVSTGDIDVTSR